MTERHENEEKDKVARLGARFHLEAESAGDGRLLIVIGGAKKILSYTSECLTLGLGEEDLSVSGQGILCRSFSSGIIEATGKIKGISFSNTKGNKEGARDTH